MPVFTVIALRDPAKVAANLEEKIEATNRYKLAENAWLVHYDGAIRDLAESIGIRSGESSTAGLCLSVQNYAGRANPDIWEWFKLHWEKEPS